LDKRTTIVLTSMALIALVVGGVGIVLADAGAPGVTQKTEDGVVEPLCQGLGLVGIRDGWGFWSTLSEEQRDELVSAIEVLIEEGAAYEEIWDTIAGKLHEWVIEPPPFSGPHYGGNGDRGLNGPYRGFGVRGHGFRGQRRAEYPTTTG
jgi:hypothetical protein